jgi:glutamyl-tRNA synthetase
MNESNNERVVTRFAPSPTGYLHVGGVRTALYSYAYARKHGGKFILRIEDTDTERNSPEAEKAIIDSMAWLGMDFDELYRQGERTDIYRKYLEKLITDGKAYESIEDSKNNPGESVALIRFKNPGEVVTFFDNVCGTVTVDTTDLGDFVIAKNLNSPIFHFANVVDDFEMGITHVIRGQEHLANTPRQILISRAIGATPLNYTHIPLVLAADKTKLSKRHGAMSVMEYKHMGYLPEAMLNFLALIGWNPGDEREIFTLPQLVNEFSLEKVQKSGGVFNIDKLNWVNREHIKLLNQAEQFILVQQFMPESVTRLENYNLNTLEDFLPLVIERIEKFEDVTVLGNSGEFDYFFDKPLYGKDQLFYGKTKFTDENKYTDLAGIIGQTVEHLKNSKHWKSENIKDSVFGYAQNVGVGDVLWPMRFALSGHEKSPDPFILAEKLGRNETFERLQAAQDLLLN